MKLTIKMLVAALRQAARSDLPESERSELFTRAANRLAELDRENRKLRAQISDANLALAKIGAEHGVTWAMDGTLRSGVRIIQETIRRVTGKAAA